MAKPGLGTKRLCPHCGAKFYDLDKSPIVCPKCASEVEVMAPSSRGRPDAARQPVAVAAPEEVEVAETPEAEFVSLEDADAEASGSKTPAAGEEEDEDVELEENIDDDTFLEEDEDEDEDVSDIIGGDIEDEEET